MANPNTPKAEQAAPQEGAPRLKAVKVEANTVGEAMDKAGGGAGQAELDWVLNPANFAKAAKMLKGGSYYFFPNAGDGVLVPSVRWNAGEFWRSSALRDDWWNSIDRVVVRD
ncbi:MAG: hypothetical protein Q7R74_01170 [bacterium]|nr:hypothetical protein [bacterium]